MTTEYIAGVDPVQRLQRDVERAVPRAGAEVPRVQLLQHPGDEGTLSRGPSTDVEEVQFSRSPKRPCQSTSCYIMVQDAVYSALQFLRFLPGRHAGCSTA